MDSANSNYDPARALLVSFNNHRAEKGLKNTGESTFVGEQLGAFVAMLAVQHASHCRDEMSNLIDAYLHWAQTPAHEVVDRLKQLPRGKVVDFAEEAYRRNKDG